MWGKGREGFRYTHIQATGKTRRAEDERKECEQKDKQSRGVCAAVHVAHCPS